MDDHLNDKNQQIYLLLSQKNMKVNIDMKGVYMLLFEVSPHLLLTYGVHSPWFLGPLAWRTV